MEERILYFDIVNGISGDMTIATLLDLGISKEVFLEEINKLNLGDEFNINIQEENEDGIVGTKVEVITKEVNAQCGPCSWLYFLRTTRLLWQTSAI